MRIKKKSTFPALPRLPKLNSTPIASTSSPEEAQGVEEWGLWGLWSAHNTLSLLLLPPHAVPMLQHGVPAVGCSSSRAAPIWVLPTGYQLKLSSVRTIFWCCLAEATSASPPLLKPCHVNPIQYENKMLGVSPVVGNRQCCWGRQKSYIVGSVIYRDNDILPGKLYY